MEVNTSVSVSTPTQTNVSREPAPRPAETSPARETERLDTQEQQVRTQDPTARVGSRIDTFA